MKKLALLALGALLPLTAVAVAIADEPSSSTMASAAAVTVPIKAQNGSGQTGTATLTQTGDDILVVIDLKGTGSDAEPAHIHPGTCAKLNPAPKYPLANVVDGKSTSTVKGVKITDLQTGGFAINVHKSTSDLATYVACGDIPKPASM
jgi:opacity protein-like surface antigen